VTPAVLLLVLVTAERLGELWLARRNTACLLANGGREVAPGHYKLIVLLHTLWLAGLWLHVLGLHVWGLLGSARQLIPIWLAVFLALQGLRLGVFATLGRRWTTRIIVLPGAPLVATGPYRFVSHPNYLVVIGEIATLPLCLGLPWYALIFSVANLAVLAIRIRAEDGALAGLRDVTSH
jgi:methyltransferase